jgi:hypothetical protein
MVASANPRRSAFAAVDSGRARVSELASIVECCSRSPAFARRESWMIGSARPAPTPRSPTGSAVRGRRMGVDVASAKAPRRGARGVQRPTVGGWLSAEKSTIPAGQHRLLYGGGATRRRRCAKLRCSSRWSRRPLPRSTAGVIAAGRLPGEGSWTNLNARRVSVRCDTL